MEPRSLTAEDLEPLDRRLRMLEVLAQRNERLTSLEPLDRRLQVLEILARSNDRTINDVIAWMRVHDAGHPAQAMVKTEAEPDRSY